MSMTVCEECWAPECMWGDCKEQDCDMRTRVDEFVEPVEQDNTSRISMLEAEIVWLKRAFDDQRDMLQKLVDTLYRGDPVVTEGKFLSALQAAATVLGDYEQKEKENNERSN